MIHVACCSRQVIWLHVGKYMLFSSSLIYLTRLGSDWQRHLEAAESEYKATQAEINHCRQVYDSVSREIERLSVSPQMVLQQRDNCVT